MNVSHRILWIPGCLALLAGCGVDETADLRQAADAFASMASPAMVQNSMFAAAFPDGTPRQFVSYLFSPFGKREWPPYDNDTEFPAEDRDLIRRTGVVFLPENVAIRHTTPDTAAGRQIVMRWNDAERLIFIDGYADPTASPLFTREIPFRPMKPSDKAQGLFEVMGVTPESSALQAF